MPGSLVIKNGVRAEFPYNIKYGKGQNLLSVLADLALEKKYRIDLEIAGDPLSRAVLSEGPHIKHRVFGTVKLLTPSDLMYDNIPGVTVNMDEGTFIFRITSENKDILNHIKKAWLILGSDRSLDFLGYTEKMMREDFVSLSKEDGEGGHFIINDSDALDFNWLTYQISMMPDEYGKPSYGIYFKDWYDEDNWRLYGQTSSSGYAKILKNIFYNIKFMQIPYLFLNKKRALTPEILEEDEKMGKFVGLTNLFLEDEYLTVCMGSDLYGGLDVYGELPEKYVIPIYDSHTETLLKEIWYLIYYLENVYIGYKNW